MVDAIVKNDRFVPFLERSGDNWRDIEPVAQYEEGLAPICAINYKKDYQEVMSYFRAVLKAKEVSERAFRLTEEVIDFSEGNYTAWYYRRKLLEELKMPLEDEMRWLQTNGLSMEKNFQIWHHRKCIAEILGDDRLDLAAEMQFLHDIFSSDRKNYHAWSYRTWLVERFQLWTDELDFVDQMLAVDRGNNSVWSYRYFILNKAPLGLFKQAAPGTVEFVRSEVEFVLPRLREDLGNEACWVYLRGMFCLTDDEEQKSKSTNVKRVRMNKLDDLLRPFLLEVH